MEPEYLSAQQAGARLGITTGRIYQLTRSGELPVQRVGRALLIPAMAVEARREQGLLIRRQDGKTREVVLR